MGLIAHSGTNYVPRDTVTAVPAPQFTPTWHPVSHADVITTIEEALEGTDLEIVKESYSLSKNGMDMFGVLQLDQQDGVMAWTLGVRNSMQKHFALGICAGIRVFVCDNLSFEGDSFLEFRRHTGGLDMYELRTLASNAVSSAIPRLRGFEEWHNRLRRTVLPAHRAKILTYDAMVQGVLPPSRFEVFRNAHLEEMKEHGDTLYSWHGAHTRLMRGMNLLTVAERHRRINQLIKQYDPRLMGGE